MQTKCLNVLSPAEAQDVNRAGLNYFPDNQLTNMCSRHETVTNGLSNGFTETLFLTWCSYTINSTNITMKRKTNIFARH